jgi:lipopolysaccharide export system permease protein
MTLLHRYIFSTLLRNFVLSASGFTFLFLIIDVFDRIDNILPEDAPFGLILEYFLLKVPFMLSTMMPVAMMVSVMLTFGVLSKNSELTAMRAAGLKILWISKPAFIFAAVMGFVTLLFNETLVPYCTRRVKEIYNIDIQQKDKKGGYSQADFWWRNGSDFYSASIFDSRDNTLHDFAWLTLDRTFQINKRFDAASVAWLGGDLGWSMAKVTEYNILYAADTKSRPEVNVVGRYRQLPLAIRDSPQEFYDVKTDPDTMSFRQLRRFMRRQAANGVPISGYYADLQQKFSFPFVVLIVVAVVLPFSLKSARSGSLAMGFVAALVVAFSYYAVHSFSLAMGRAELWPPLLAAWMANILMGIVGAILLWGAESPS